MRLQREHSRGSLWAQSSKMWVGGGTGAKAKLESSEDAADVPINSSLVLLQSHICRGNGDRVSPVPAQHTFVHPGVVYLLGDTPPVAAPSSLVCTTGVLHLLGDAPL